MNTVTTNKVTDRGAKNGQSKVVQMSSPVCASLREEEPSDLSQDLHDSDGGALAEDESSTEQGHCSPDCEGDSGEDKVRCD